MSFIIINLDTFVPKSLNLLNSILALSDINSVNHNIQNYDNTNYLLTSSFFLYSFITINPTLIFTLKVTLCLMFLIVIRGCVPRYRYDFLTKMGWVKFLGYVLAIFLISVTLFLIW